MSRKLILFALLIPSLAAAGCREIVTPRRPDGGTESYIYVDEPIVLRTSRFIPPIDTDLSAEGNEYLFDVSPIVRFFSGGRRDFELVYLKPSSCSEDVSIYDFRTASWDTIAYGSPHFFGCLMVITEAGNLFSANEFDTYRYINDWNAMRVYGRVYEPKLRGVQLNPRYFQVPMPEVDGAHGATLIEYGLAFDGEAFWVISYWLNRIYRVSLSGEILDSFPTPYEHPISITYDGENLWLSFSDLLIASVDTDGNLLCQFFLYDYSIFVGPLYLAWADGMLWCAHRGSQLEDGCHFLRIDPMASCTAGLGVIDGGFDLDERYWIVGLGWNGSTLWALGDSLYEYSRAGKHLASHDLKVAKPLLGIAWEGDTFYLMHAGPAALKSRDKVVSRFKIR